MYELPCRQHKICWGTILSLDGLKLHRDRRCHFFKSEIHFYTRHRLMHQGRISCMTITEDQDFSPCLCQTKTAIPDHQLHHCHVQLRNLLLLL